jgi:putative acetyltransferase
VIIHHESPDDVAAIRAITIAAFLRDEEADLLDQLRADGDLMISLVAEDGGVIVGHAAYSPGRIKLTGGGTVATAALGPISVSPEVQKGGIGSALMERGFAECRAMGYDLMFLLGHPSYYPRFGFVRAKALGVRWGPDTSEHPNPAWMVKELREGALTAALGGDTGVFHYAPAFDGR